MSAAASVAQVRRLQVTPKGAREKLKRYPDEVLTAAMRAEEAAADARPLFVRMLEAELERRKQENHMDAAPPQVIATGQHALIPLASLTPSPYNRKRFDAAKMAELTENVRLQGVIEPIIVRARADVAGEFEIVAGERRFRAAKGAGLAEIPAIIRELTDAQSIELRVIENHQREDEHPLEEAEGYEALMRFSYTADEIAAKVGKSRSYVFARLKLLALCEEARQAFYEDKLDASRALLIARIPSAQLQLKAMKEIVEGEYEGAGPMSYRAAVEHMKWNYTLRLKEAPFKTTDADLVPAAGACTICPKRSGNQPELFADIESADVCTDPECFGQKRDAQLELMRVAAEAKGKDVIAHGARGVVRLDERVKGDWQGRTYRQLLGSKAPTPQLMPDVQDGKAKLVEVVKKSEVQPTISKKLAAQRAGGGSIDYAAKQREDELVGRQLLQHIMAAIPVKPAPREFEILIKDAAGEVDQEDLDVLAELLLQDGKSGDGEARLVAAAARLDSAGAIRLLVSLMVASEARWPDRLKDTADAYGVKFKAIEASVRAQLKADKKATKTKVEAQPTEEASEA